MNTPCWKIINMLLFQVLSSQMFKLYHTKTIYWRYYNIHDVQNVQYVQKRANLKKYINNICWIILIMRKKCFFDLFAFNINVFWFACQKKTYSKLQYYKRLLCSDVQFKMFWYFCSDYKTMTDSVKVLGDYKKNYTISIKVLWNFKYVL